MIITAFSVPKGGAGKTTLTSHAGFRAIERNLENILICDMDVQGNAIKWLSGFEAEEDFITIKGVEIQYNYYDFDEAEANDYDMVLIDCPPNPEIVKEFIDDVDLWVVPVDGRFSIESCIDFLENLSDEATILIVPNKVNLNYKVSREEMEEINKIDNENVIIWDEPITQATAIRTAEMHGKPLWNVPMGTRNKNSQRLRNLADFILDLEWMN